MIEAGLNTLTSFSSQIPFVIALGIYFDVFRHHNFALGSVYAAALCLIVRLFSSGTPLWASLLVAGAAVFLILAALELGLFGPLSRKRSADEILIATLGANIVLEQLLSMAFGDRVHFPRAISGNDGLSWILALPPTQVAAVIGCALVVLPPLVLRRTESGARMIALGENPDLFRSLGFSVVRTQLVALALVSVTLSISALSVVELTGAYPTAGFPLVILGLLTRLIGGPAHRIAFYLAAAGVTVFDQAAAIILPGEWRTVALFGALLLLIARRSGREERR